MWDLIKRFAHSALTENDDVSFCGVRLLGYTAIATMVTKYALVAPTPDHTQALGVAIATISGAIAAKHFVEQR